LGFFAVGTISLPFRFALVVFPLEVVASGVALLLVLEPE
jgi:hypothetical protein